LARVEGIAVEGESDALGYTIIEYIWKKDGRESFLGRARLPIFSSYPHPNRTLLKGSKLRVIARTYKRFRREAIVLNSHLRGLQHIREEDIADLVKRYLKIEYGAEVLGCKVIWNKEG